MVKLSTRLKVTTLVIHSFGLTLLSRSCWPFWVDTFMPMNTQVVYIYIYIYIYICICKTVNWPGCMNHRGDEEVAWGDGLQAAQHLPPPQAFDISLFAPKNCGRKGQVKREEDRTRQGKAERQEKTRQIRYKAYSQLRFRKQDTRSPEHHWRPAMALAKKRLGVIQKANRRPR